MLSPLPICHCVRVAMKTSSTGQRRQFSHQRQRYSVAIARQVPNSFSNAITKFAAASSSSTGKDIEPITVMQAQTQWDHYIKMLRKHVPTLSLPPLNEHADSVFVEDTVVAIGNKAVITQPGHPSRQGEVDTIKDVLLRLGYDIIDMRDDYGSALCDGGDVLYTGRHLFVGLSERTNQEAVHVLETAFGMKVIAVPMQGDEQALHLKSIVTHMDESTLLAPMGRVGDQVLEAMNAESNGYTSIRLPSMLACNVVAVNGGLIAQDTGCRESMSLLLDGVAVYYCKSRIRDDSAFNKIIEHSFC